MDKTQIEAFAEMFLPAQWLPWVRVALEAVAALSVLLVALRPALALVPQGPARSWIDAFDRILNALAVNSRPLGERIAPEPKRKSVKP